MFKPRSILHCINNLGWLGEGQPQIQSGRRFRILFFCCIHIFSPLQSGNWLPAYMATGIHVLSEGCGPKMFQMQKKIQTKKYTTTHFQWVINGYEEGLCIACASFEENFAKYTFELPDV